MHGSHSLGNLADRACVAPPMVSNHFLNGTDTPVLEAGSRAKDSHDPACGVPGAGVEPVAGYGASPAPFPQFLPRWARAEALDRPTGTTVAALDARRRVPRRPDVVQLDAGEVAGNDRVPLVDGDRADVSGRHAHMSTSHTHDPPIRPTPEMGLK